jgi:hypothetical protein
MSGGGENGIYVGNGGAGLIIILKGNITFKISSLP